MRIYRFSRSGGYAVQHSRAEVVNSATSCDPLLAALAVRALDALGAAGMPGWACVVHLADAAGGEAPAWAQLLGCTVGANRTGLVN